MVTWFQPMRGSNCRTRLAAMGRLFDDGGGDDGFAAAGRQRDERML